LAGLNFNISTFTIGKILIGHTLIDFIEPLETLKILFIFPALNVSKDLLYPLQGNNTVKEEVWIKISKEDFGEWNENFVENGNN